MKRVFFTFFALASVLLVMGCSKKEEVKVNELVVGATPEPHAVLLNAVADELKKEGITLKIVEFTDYVTPNQALESGELLANFFQHVPYMKSFNTEHDGHLVSVGTVHVEPLALYSKKYKTLKDLPDGASIALPNDPTNEGRALLLLQSAHLLALNPGAGLTATPVDIVSNPHNFTFTEVEAASLPRVLADVDAAIINGNYAIPAGLSAKKDGLLAEGKDSPYANIVAVKAGNENDPRIKALMKALQSTHIRRIIQEKYSDGAVLPAF